MGRLLYRWACVRNGALVWGHVFSEWRTETNAWGDAYNKRTCERCGWTQRHWQ